MLGCLKFHSFWIFVLLAASLTILPACVRGTPTSNNGSLVIYSGRSELLVGPLIQQFSNVTGVDVSVKYASTSEIASVLLEEGENSPADVFFAQDPG